MGLFSNFKSALSGKSASHSTAQPASVAAASVSASGLESPETSAVQKRILFVDGDATVGQEFAQLVQERRRSWEFTAVPGAPEAFALIADKPFDAVVASAQLAGKSGVELLNEVSRRHPGLPRVIRYAPEDKPLLRGFVGWPPSHLTREMDVGEIEAGLECAFQMGEWMNDAGIKALLPKMLRLPTVPDLYGQVMTLLGSPTSSVEDVGKLIAREPALTAKMLQMVNSAVFALARPVTNAVEAVMFLGAERTKALILIANASLNYDLSGCENFSQEQFWRHSLATAGLARAITLLESRDAALADEAFTAGLLHDVGKLLFAANLTEKYSHTLSVARNQKMMEEAAERMGLGASHAEIGACLLGTWGLPLRLLRAIAWHHAPSNSDDGKFSLLTAVHVANAFDHGRNDGPNDAPMLKLDRHYLSRIGLSERWLKWRELSVADDKAA